MGAFLFWLLVIFHLLPLIRAQDATEDHGLTLTGRIEPVLFTTIRPRPTQRLIDLVRNPCRLVLVAGDDLEPTWMCQWQPKRRAPQYFRIQGWNVPSTAVSGKTSLFARFVWLRFSEDQGETIIDLSRSLRIRAVIDKVEEIQHPVDSLQDELVLQPALGVHRALAIRVKGNDTDYPATVEELVDNVFEDQVSMSSQFRACSYGQFEVNPFNSTFVGSNFSVPNGVLSVEFEENLIGVRYSTISQSVFALGEELWGVNWTQGIDHFMFFLPNGTDFARGIAFGQINGPITWYRYDWTFSNTIMVRMLDNIYTAF